MFSYNSVYQGDCRNILKSFPTNSFDLVLTDPPYFVNYRDRFGRTVANDRDELGILSAFDEVHRVLKPDSVCISFYGWSRIDVAACGVSRRRAHRLVQGISVPSRHAPAAS